MIEGTGPGRGFPWWRSGRIITLTHLPGVVGAERTLIQRPGRLVAKVGVDTKKSRL